MTKRAVNRAMTLVCVALAALLVVLVIELASFRRAQDASVRAQAESISQGFKSEIADRLERVEIAARELGERFGREDLSEAQIKSALKETSESLPEIRGITACYEPFAFRPDRRLFCPFYDKAIGDFIFVEDNYDYTTREDGTLWYGAVVDGGARWVDPYYGTGAQEWFIDYGVPFAASGQTRGVIDFSVGVGDFQSVVHDLSVGKSNASYIVTQSGAFVAHPASGYVGVKTVADMTAEPETSDALRAAFAAVLEGESGTLDAVDFNEKSKSKKDGGRTGSEDVIIYDFIPGAGYGVVSTYLRRDLLNDEKAVHRRFIRLSLVFSLLLILASIRYFARDQLDADEIEGLSITTALILLANVVFVGALQHSLSSQRTLSESPPIVDLSTLAGFIDVEASRADDLKVAAPIPIPTGLFIERMDFADSYNVNLGGVIWQKYPLAVADAVETGIRLPQMSPFAEAALIEESFRKDVSGTEGQMGAGQAGVDGDAGYRLIGYDFRVTLRLNLSYRDFPFDKRHLDIRILPASRTDALMLVPDLAGYTSTNPTELAGVSRDIELPGNRLVESYFNFTFEDYATDFGFGEAGARDRVPALHFNIHQKRYLLNSFVTYLIPIGVTLSLIYILILATEKTSERQGIIESMAAFFFVLIFSHIDLRKDVVTADLIFIEYFYFITYGMIILATFNLITYSKSRVSYFDYNDNQIFRALYFPVFLGLLLAVMLSRFY